MLRLRKYFQSWKIFSGKSNVLFYLLVFMDRTIKVITSILICCWLSLTDFVCLHLLQKIQNLMGNFFFMIKKSVRS
jgi:hypothetical protein